MGLVLHKMKVLVRWRGLAGTKLMCCNYLKNGDFVWPFLLASAALFFTLFFGLGVVHAVAAPNITPIISLLLSSDQQPDTTKIIIGEKGLITAFKGKTLHSRITVAVGDMIEDNSKYSFALLSGPAGLTLSASGDIEYEVPSGAATSANSLQVKATRKTDGKSYSENGEIVIMVTEVVASGAIGPEGGRIADEWEDVVFTVPPGAVTGPTTFEVLRAIDENGNYSYTINASAPLLKILELRLPDKSLREAPQDNLSDVSKRVFVQEKSKVLSIQSVHEKGREPSASWKYWTSNFADFATVDARLLDPTSVDATNRVMNGATLLPIHGKLRIDHLISSQLYSLCNESPYDCGEKTPVLFVHGYTPKGELGGGEGTWGKLPELLAAAGYAVFEFNWATNARFEDAAADLGQAIELISDTTHKKVHIVAHSFGGLLSRTYLQNYAEGRPYRQDVQSLVTLGTPHSGIFDDDGTYHGLTFKEGSFDQGQDSSTFEGCMQLSCHEAGEPTPNAWTIEQWPSDDIFIYPSFGIDPNAGQIVAKIDNTGGEHTLPVDTLVLMGLPLNESGRYTAGDGLITYEGQRFDRTWASSKVHQEPQQVGSSKVTERILGVTQYDPEAVPGGQRPDVLYEHWGLFKGYYHSTRVPAYLFAGAYVRAAEPNVANSSNVQGTDAPHAALAEIKAWLKPSEATYAPDGLMINIQVVDANTQQPIQGARISYSIVGIEYGNSVGYTDSDGYVYGDLPFYAEKEYIFTAYKYGYHGESFEGYVTGSSIQSSNAAFSRELQPDQAARGGLAGQVVSTTTGLPLAGVNYTLSRNGIEWSGVTDASGNYSVSNLVIGTYELKLSKSGYMNETFYFTVRAGQTSPGNASMRDAQSVPGTVTSAGQVWMDRNLGASRVATSSTDSAAYGDLYQWGRGADGHQLRTSPTTATTSATDAPGHGSFITTNTTPYDWRVPQNNSLWQGVSGTNNPCPAGFRLPTDTELDTERASWVSNDPAGAYASPLKLVVAGDRSRYVGALSSVGSVGRYWSGTVFDSYARFLSFESGDAGMYSNYRVNGYSLRCLKD